MMNNTWSPWSDYNKNDVLLPRRTYLTIDSFHCSTFREISSYNPWKQNGQPFSIFFICYDKYPYKNRKLTSYLKMCAQEGIELWFISKSLPVRSYNTQTPLNKMNRCCWIRVLYGWKVQNFSNRCVKILSLVEKCIRLARARKTVQIDFVQHAPLQAYRWEEKVREKYRKYQIVHDSL